MIYIIESSSCWMSGNCKFHGYVDDEDVAIKYCALKNSNIKNNEEYSYIKLKQINPDVSNIIVKKYHEVVFDLCRGMRKEPDRFEYYVGEDRPLKKVYNPIENGWLSISITSDSREEAEKVATEFFNQWNTEYRKTGSYEIAGKCIGATCFHM